MQKIPEAATRLRRGDRSAASAGPSGAPVVQRRATMQMPRVRISRPSAAEPASNDLVVPKGAPVRPPAPLPARAPRRQQRQQKHPCRRCDPATMGDMRGAGASSRASATGANRSSGVDSRARSRVTSRRQNRVPSQHYDQQWSAIWADRCGIDRCLGRGSRLLPQQIHSNVSEDCSDGGSVAGKVGK